jgi:uncharacterized protein (DUF2235 family)
MGAGKRPYVPAVKIGGWQPVEAADWVMPGGRDLIVLADGTGNSAAKSFKTNVWRLYQALDLTDGSQLAVFGDGVGTSSFKPLQLLGLALGVGVKRNVLNLYKFWCRSYNEGDRLWAFGFSRGAFTVRVLAGLVHQEGLVSFRSEEELDRAAIAAYRSYRSKSFPTRLPWVFVGRAIRDRLVEFWNWITGARQYHEIKAETFERRRHIINLHFVGVWDTVAAYGLPVDELTQAVDKWVWPMSFRDTSLLPNVVTARHALSLDDERRTFFPIPWNETDERNLHAEDATFAADRLLQVWFVGTHANVGGGYPDDSLSYVPLCWMIGEAASKGLRFRPSTVTSYTAIASPTGRLYDSRAGFGTFYRYQPRDVQSLIGQGNRPLVHYDVVTRMAEGNDGYAPISLPHDFNIWPPFGGPVAFDRDEATRLLSTSPQPPANLPLLPGRSLSDARAAMIASLRYVIGMSEPEGGHNRASLVDLVLDTVWWRRLLYFVSLFLALLAGVYPLVYEFLREPGITDRLNQATGGEVDWAIGLIKGFVPAFATPWLVAIGKNPAIATLIVAALALTLLLSSFLQRRIRDRARAAWHVQAQADGQLLDHLRLRGQRRAASGVMVFFAVFIAGALILGGSTFLKIVLGIGLLVSAACSVWRSRREAGSIDVGRPGFLLALARSLRLNPVAVWYYRFVAKTVVPALFLVLSGLVVFCGIYRATFDGMSAAGTFCKGSVFLKDDHPTENLGEGKEFPTNAVCHPTGLSVVEGRRYRIALTMTNEWFDKLLETDVGGFAASDPVHYLGLPFKRWWLKNWFEPIARIGPLGTYEFALDPEAPIPVVSFQSCRQPDKPGLLFVERLRDIPRTIDETQKRASIACDQQDGLQPTRVLISDFRANSSGELFIYVNDAVLLWPGAIDFFYRNNSGSARVELKRIAADGIVEGP